MNILTELKEGLGLSWEAIRANKLRSILTTLGIVIGIVTVTLMATAIQGLDHAFLKSISALGADVLFVERRGWFIGSREEWIKMSKRKMVTLTQARALQKQITFAQAVAPVVFMAFPIKYKNRSSSRVDVIGTTEDFLITGGVTVASGRFLSAGEVEGGRPVCVVGADVAANLFPNESPIGNKVQVGQSTFEVVGVLEKRGSFLGMASLDNQVIISIKQVVSNFLSNPDCGLQVKVMDLERLEDTKEEVRGVMRKIRQVRLGEPDDFAINQQEQFIAKFNTVAGMIGAVGLFITGLSLFVGGIGIMNIMFVSVAERTREIGIRKAIGAKRRTILLQFLMEAASICLLGGLIALGIAFLLTLLIAKFLPVAMSLPVVGLALGVSLLTGVVSGFFPAWRAASMNPVDALRNE